ncbi:MAG: DUF3866 family protein [Actinobacteria bacterium]|nr:DUF3866 family protein [Actinomycetota bacterium]
MAAFRNGVVTELFEDHADLIRVRVRLADASEVEASGFPRMLGPVAVGDEVVVNTTGIELGLGTGGEAFILWNLSGVGPSGPGEGHIVKLRYTPWQTEVPAVEAQESPHHDALVDVDSIDGLPVVVCGLHSQIAAVAAGIKAATPSARVGYLMTDGAALPIAWSRLVRDLRVSGLIDVTATAGHAFGGELEVVNVHSGLAALAHVSLCDVVIVAMGPGVVGTGTALGFTALEQSGILDAAGVLGGIPVASLRINFSDERHRHQGLSHHSLTALRMTARDGAVVPVPVLADNRSKLVTDALEGAGIGGRHHLIEVDGAPGLEYLAGRDITPSSMGRDVHQIPELFLAAAAAGRAAAERLATGEGERLATGEGERL